MLGIITERMRAGVDVKIIGCIEGKWNLPCEPFPGKRLHVRAMIRDGQRVHRQPEPPPSRARKLFQLDWFRTEAGRKEAKKAAKAEKKEEKQLAEAS